MLLLEIENIIQMPCLTVLPPAYDGYQMLYIKTKTGDYDLLFNAAGELAERNDIVARIETFVNKKFQPVTVEGQKWLAHIIPVASH